MTSRNSDLKLLITLKILLCLAFAAQVVRSSRAEVISADRRMDWRAGVPGGIPNRPVYKTLSNLDTTGTISATADIQKAISSCPKGQAILLPPGKLLLTGPITMVPGVTLRGAGPDQTTLVVGFSPWASGVIIFGVDAFPDSVSDLSGSYGAKTATLNFAASTSVATGDFVIIDQLNNAAEVSNVGYPGNNVCTDCDRAAGARVQWQVSRITSKPSSTSITIDPPLLFPLIGANKPQVARVPYWISQAGVEDLAITNAVGTTGATVYMDQAFQCWVKNVRSDRAYRKHIWLYRVLQCEIRDSIIRGGAEYTSNAGYGIEAEGSTASLIENNVFDTLHIPVMTDKGGGGNVIAYNYDGTVRKDNVDGLPTDFSGQHGPHVMMNLWEGNVFHKFYADFYFGSSSYCTLFRNAISGMQTNYANSRRAITLDRYNRYYNVVGNVLGYAGMSGYYQQENVSSSWSDVMIYRLGYTSDGDGDVAGNDPAVLATLLRHGNFDYVTKATVWDPGIADRTIPVSLYLTAKPSWWNNSPWPAIGPDVSGLMAPLPAQDRYLSLSLGGTISQPPVIGTAPAAPQNFRIVQ